MNIGLNASQARAKSSQDMIVFDECQSIMRSIITASGIGNYEISVADDTHMTTSTPFVTTIGTVNTPVVVSGDTFIINGVTIALANIDPSLDGVVTDINNANVPGVIASNDSGYLVLSIEIPASTTWTYEIGSGTANAALGFTAGVFTVTNPVSVDYFTTWQGTYYNRSLDSQMAQVLDYFRNLGYKIDRISNTQTGKTFSWYLYW